MKKIFLTVLLAVFVLSACAVTPGRGSYGVVVAPPLPLIVVLEEEPYYYHSGYHYYYRNGGWAYSSSRSGPWVELPRDHYPKEVRFKEKGRGDERNRGLKRGHDKDDKE